MPRLLPADCLNEIFENLDDDNITLHSCLLVNRLWCRVSVRILWREIWSFIYSAAFDRQLEMKLSILSTLISCLPNESKELLRMNEIFISTPTSNSPLFNYASFCKVLEIEEIYQIINLSMKLNKLNDSNRLVIKEILKMFMNQISSLKILTCHNACNIPFTNFPGARDCLTDLSDLHCSSSDINHKKLSQICHNLRSLTIRIESKISNELKELVSSQNNLKNLKLSVQEGSNLADIIPALTRHSNTLTKLQLCGNGIDRLRFVSSFLNLQEIKISFRYYEIRFIELQYVTLPKLQILKIPYHRCSNPEYLIKFLEINGKNLKEFYIFNNALNSSIVKFCPNLKKLFVTFSSDELKAIFNSCQNLEGIVVWCPKIFSNEKEVLETIAKHSPENFYELKLHRPKLSPEVLESFFISWQNRTSKNSLRLIIVGNILKVKKESIKIIEKYKNLGIIKKFEILKYRSDALYL